MKKLLFVFTLLVSVHFSFASFVTSKPDEHAVVTKAQSERALMEMVSKMSVKDYENLTGKKMNVFEKLAFKIEKKRFQKQLKKADATEGFNLGGFALGLLLGLIGVLLAYIFSKDANLRKWSWIGFGILAVIVIIAAVL